MSELRDKQAQFARMAAQLILKAFELGYGVTLGDAFRDPRVPYGHTNSLHRYRLAIDLNLFDKDGNYLQGTEDHRKLGEWWESIGGTWGGRFPDGDGNHYSLAYNGMR